MKYIIQNRNRGTISEVTKQEFEALSTHPSWKYRYIFRKEGNEPPPPKEAKKTENKEK